MHFLLPIYIVTAVISIAVALLLMHLTRLTSQARVKAEKQKRTRIA